MTSTTRPTTPAIPTEDGEALSPLMSEIVLNSDMGDSWGAAMGWAFALCDRLHFLHREATPAGLHYRPAAIHADSWEPETPEDELLAELDPTVEEMTAAAEVLDRWIDLLQDAGLSY